MTTSKLVLLALALGVAGPALAAKKKLQGDAAKAAEDLISAVEAKCAANDLAGAEGAIAAAEKALAGK